MCLLYLKVIYARPLGPKEAFGDLWSPKTTLLTASFLRPKALKDPVDIFDARPREIHYHLQTEARSLMISFSQYVA